MKLSTPLDAFILDVIEPEFEPVFVNAKVPP
jgi:hypothetical protein